MIVDPAYCNYCLGDVAFNESTLRWEHLTNGDRVKAESPGDFVTAAHNRAGTPVNAADVEFSSDDESTYHEVMTTDVNVDDENLTEPITDVAGYLSCGCHGSWSDHVCKDRDASEYTPEI